MASSRIEGQTAGGRSYAGLINTAAVAVLTLLVAAPLTASAAGLAPLHTSKPAQNPPGKPARQRIPSCLPRRPGGP